MDFLRKVFASAFTFLTTTAAMFAEAMWLSLRFPVYGPQLLRRRFEASPPRAVDPIFFVFLAGALFTGAAFRSDISSEAVTQLLRGTVDQTLNSMAFSGLFFTLVVVLGLGTLRFLIRYRQSARERLGIVINAPRRRFLTLPPEPPRAKKRWKALPYAMVGGSTGALLFITLVYALPGAEEAITDGGQAFFDLFPRTQLGEIDFSFVSETPLDQPIYVGTLALGALWALVLAPFFWPVSMVLFFPLRLATPMDTGRALGTGLGAWVISAVTVAGAMVTLTVYTSSRPPEVVEEMRISGLVCEVLREGGVEAGFTLENKTGGTATIPPDAFNLTLAWELPPPPGKSINAAVPLLNDRFARTLAFEGAEPMGYVQLAAGSRAAVTIASPNLDHSIEAGRPEGAELACFVTTGVLVVRGKTEGASAEAVIARLRR